MKPGLDLHDLKELFFSPKTFWQRISSEEISVRSLYLLYLILFPALLKSCTALFRLFPAPGGPGFSADVVRPEYALSAGRDLFVLSLLSTPLVEILGCFFCLLSFYLLIGLFGKAKSFPMAVKLTAFYGLPMLLLSIMMLIVALVLSNWPQPASLLFQGGDARKVILYLVVALAYLALALAVVSALSILWQGLRAGLDLSAKQSVLFIPLLLMLLVVVAVADKAFLYPFIEQVPAYAAVAVRHREELAKEGQIKAQVNRMVEESGAVKDWQKRAKEKGQEVVSRGTRLTEVEKIEWSAGQRPIEAFLLGGRPILFYGTVKQLEPKTENTYRLIVEYDPFMAPQYYAPLMDPKTLDCNCEAELVSGILDKVASATGKGHEIRAAVIASVARVETGDDRKVTVYGTCTRAIFGGDDLGWDPLSDKRFVRHQENALLGDFPVRIKAVDWLPA